MNNKELFNLKSLNKKNNKSWKLKESEFKNRKNNKENNLKH